MKSIQVSDYTHAWLMANKNSDRMSANAVIEKMIDDNHNMYGLIRDHMDESDIPHDEFTQYKIMKAKA